MPVIEAALKGIPCVVSNGSSLDELTNIFTGLSFDRNSYKSFKSKCLTIINDNQNYKLQARKNIQNIETILDWSYQINKFLKILKND